MIEIKSNILTKASFSTSLKPELSFTYENHYSEFIGGKYCVPK